MQDSYNITSSKTETFVTIIKMKKLETISSCHKELHIQCSRGSKFGSDIKR